MAGRCLPDETAPSPLSGVGRLVFPGARGNSTGSPGRHRTMWDDGAVRFGVARRFQSEVQVEAENRLGDVAHGGVVAAGVVAEALERLGGGDLVPGTECALGLLDDHA